VARSKPKLDRRLLGTWQSDRRRTFRHFKPKAGTTPGHLRKLKALFGKLVIRWGRGRYDTELDGHRDSGNYEVIGGDVESVVVRYRDALTGQDRITQIHFAGDHYWLSINGGLIEWFRRVAP
jgi:hypothetical protein